MRSPLQEVEPILPGYGWITAASRFRDLSTGRMVARSKILELLSAQVRAGEEALNAGIMAYHEGSLSRSTFLVRSTSLLKRLYLQNAALGSGGWDALGKVEWGRIGGTLRSEYAYLQDFADEVEEGTVSAAQAANRMNMYVGKARRQFFLQERKTLPSAKRGKVIIEKRNLAPVEHCPSCVRYYEMGWQLVGVLPLPTEACECMGNCRCSVERKSVGRESLDRWISRRIPLSELTEVWNEEDHPREPLGVSVGGRFAYKGKDLVVSPEDETDRISAIRHSARAWALVSDSIRTKYGFPSLKDTEDEEWLGDWFSTGLDPHMVETEAPHLKNDVVTALAEDTGISMTEADNWIRTWSHSSGDGFEPSVALQVAAAKRFGLDPGPYAKVPETPKVWSSLDVPLEHADRVVESIYSRTQTRLKEYGITSVRAYRGMVLDGKTELEAGDVGVFRSWPLSSWSLDRREAAEFSMFPANGKHGILLVADIPVDRIFSTPSTGIGCLKEAEFVVLGGTDEVRVLSSVNRPLGEGAFLEDWDPALHPREPLGTSTGGQFTSTNTTPVSLTKPVLAPLPIGLTEFYDVDYDKENQEFREVIAGSPEKTLNIGWGMNHPERLIYDDGVSVCKKESKDVAGTMLGDMEVIARRVDEKLGLGLVPPTEKKRQGKFTSYSYQKWVENTQTWSDYQISNYKTTGKMGEGWGPQWGILRCFDLLMGNEDRHGGNLLISKSDGRLWAIDNGLSFPDLVHIDSLTKVPRSFADRLRQVTDSDWLGITRSVIENDTDAVRVARGLSTNARRLIEISETFAEWNEEDHPRVPEGDSAGGQFADKGSRSGPKGSPLSGRLKLSKTLDKDTEFARSVKGAINAIDQVHGAPFGFSLPVGVNSEANVAGRFTTNEETGVPKRVTISTKSPTPGLTTAHELGHYLDWSFGRGEYLSESNAVDFPEWKKWKAAALGSPVIKRLSAESHSVHMDVNGKEYTSTDFFKSYLSSSREVFARSYAQYIAVRSGDSGMMGELRRIQNKESMFGANTQWTDEEFAPIADAFDEIFSVAEVRG